MRFSLLAALVALVPGCFADPGDMHGDETFTAAEREDIVTGAEWLAAQTGHPARAIVFDLPHDADCGAGDILRTEGSGGVRDAHTGCIVLGVANQRSREQFQALAAHELGHSKRLDHVDDPASLMWHDLPKLRWSKADQAECRRVGYCVAIVAVAVFTTAGCQKKQSVLEAEADAPTIGIPSYKVLQ